MSQYALGLSLPAIYTDENFIVSDCNREAHQWVHAWPKWPAHGLMITGPSGSGKTHLAAIWSHKAQATIIDAAQLTDTIISNIDSHILIEDIEHCPSEEALLHAFNITRENKRNLLMTCHKAVQHIPFTLPDLTSRLKSLPSTTIQAPDDTVIGAILRKQFADKQLKIDEETIAYLLPRIDRSFSEIKILIDTLDNEALKQKKRLTIPFVRQFLSLPTMDAE